MILKAVSTIAMALALTATVAIPSVRAEESVGEKMAEGGRDVKKGAKKAVRKVKDETCEMVNGKMECAAKKAGHKIENATDEVKDKAE